MPCSDADFRLLQVLVSEVPTCDPAGRPSSTNLRLVRCNRPVGTITRCHVIIQEFSFLPTISRVFLGKALRVLGRLLRSWARN